MTEADIQYPFVFLLLFVFAHLNQLTGEVYSFLQEILPFLQLLIFLKTQALLHRFFLMNPLKLIGFFQYCVLILSARAQFPHFANALFVLQLLYHDTLREDFEFLVSYHQ